MILIVAPYTGYNTNGNIFLGASKKIRFIVKVLSQIDSEIVLLNTAHNDESKSDFQQRRLLLGGAEITEVILPTYGQRATGKLRNLFDVQRSFERVISIGTPKLIWFYNGYSFEMLFANYLSKRLSSPMILEFEDWHFSRSRRLNVKPVLDFVLWSRSCRLMTRVYAVNNTLRQKSIAHCNDTRLLPGTITDELVRMSKKHIPFSRENNVIYVGYFGGLSTEKGADIVLQLAKELPDNFKVQVTGTGPMSELFKEESATVNGNLFYHGVVDDAKLLDIICECDLILNPHLPLGQFQNGIFPSKIIEAIASRRLLISTPLSFEGFEDVSEGTVFVEHSDKHFRDAILASPEHYHSYKEIINSAADAAVVRFGESAIADSIKLIIE